MRKIFLSLLAVAAGGAAITAGVICSGCGQDQSVTDPHASYSNLFNQRLAEMRQAASQGKHVFGQPDMFFLHDKLQRMDPATGEIPEGAMMRAYRDLVAQFGEIDYNPIAKTNHALTWEERGPTNIGGRTRAFMFDPNDATGKAAFSGGVGGGFWRNPDITSSSSQWVQVSPLFSNIAVTCCAYDPSNTDVMYFGTGEGWNNADSQVGAGLWKSTDAGSTWEWLLSTDAPQFNYCNRIAVTSSGHVYVGTKGGLHKSTDGGATFTKVLGSGTGAGTEWVTDIVVAANGDLYAGCSSTGVYKSAASLGATQGNAGSWTKLITGFTGGFERVQLAPAETDANYIYALTSISGNTDKVYRSTDAGSTWAATSSQPNGGTEWSNGQAWYDLCIAVDPSNKNFVLVGAIDVYRTTNGGSSWSRITAVYGGPQPYIHPDQHTITFRKGFSGDYVISNDGGNWLTMDNAATFVERNNNYCVTQYYAMDIEQKAGSLVIIGGTQDNGSSRVNTAGKGPGDGLTGADGGYCNINYLKPDTMYTTTQWETVLRTRNGGTTFSGITNPDLDETNTMFINPIEMDPNNPEILYQASTRLWRHNNAGSGGGGGWTEDTKDYSSQITAIGISKSMANLVYFAVGGNVYRYPNAHAGNFTSNPPSVNPTSLPSGYVSCIAVDPFDENHIVITYSSFSVTKKVMETRDADLGAAATWRNLNGNLPDMPVNWAVFEPGNPEGVLIGTDFGVFRCSDISVPEADVFWSPERKNLGMPRVSMLRRNYNDNAIHIATHGRGFFSTYSYNQPPIANFGIEQDTVCGGAVQFVDSTENPATSWDWDFGDGGTSTTGNPVHVYTSSGIYTVTMIVSNASGSDTLERTVDITVAPAAVATSMPDTSICPGSSLMLTASGGGTYLWSPALNLDDPNSATPMVTGLTSTRTYTVTVTNAWGCVDTEAVKISILPAPPTWAGVDKFITALGDSVMLDGTGAVSYSWSPTTGLSCTTCPTPKASPAVTTTYTLTGTGANGCTSNDNVTVHVDIVGVSEPAPAQGNWLFQVSPNPVSATAQVHYRLAAAGTATVELLDLRGRLVRTLADGSAPAGDRFLSLDASTLEGGIYFVRLRTGGETFAQKFVVQR